MSWLKQVQEAEDRVPEWLVRVFDHPMFLGLDRQTLPGADLRHDQGKVVLRDGEDDRDGPNSSDDHDRARVARANHVAGVHEAQAGVQRVGLLLEGKRK